eukprot:122866_1
MGTDNSCDSKTTIPNSNGIQITVHIEANIGLSKYEHIKLVIHSEYEKEQKMKHIFHKITNHVNEKYDPVKYEIDWIFRESFTGRGEVSEFENQSITEYDINEIQNKGLKVIILVKYNHEVCNVLISCPEMKRLGTVDAMKCSVYRGMKESYKYSAENLYHLEQYTHFTDEYGAKTECSYKDECKAYRRLQDGGNALKDKCHREIYRHPPSKMNIQLQDNVNALFINKNQEENHKIYLPTPNDKQRYNWNKSDGYLRALVEEVI